MISGGYMFDGEHEIRPLDKTEVEDCVQQIRDCRLSHIVVSGVFSPVNNSQEIQVLSLLSNVVLLQYIHTTPIAF